MVATSFNPMVISFNNYSLSLSQQLFTELLLLVPAPRTQERKDVGRVPLHILAGETDSKLCERLCVAKLGTHGGREDLGWKGESSSVLTMLSVRCL